MRIPRCYFDGKLAPGDEVELSEDESRHLATVLRAETGRTLVLVNGRGDEATATLLAVGKRTGARVSIVSLRHRPAESVLPELAVALTKGDATDDLLVRSVELGISRWCPVVTDHSAVLLKSEAAARRVDRWEKQAVGALKQSERLWMPEIEVPLDVEKLLNVFRADGVVPVALMERDAEAPPLLDVLGGLDGKPVAFLVGPEGGWSAAEREWLSSPRVVRASLGSHVLRTETAAIAALAAWHALARG